MRDSVSFWRRVAGLHLSAAPMSPDGSRDDAMSAGALHPEASAFSTGGDRQKLYLLCEAIDLVVSAQGYNSPAVPPLLHALIGAVRLLRATPVTGMDRPAPATTQEPPPVREEPAPPEPEPGVGPEPEVKLEPEAKASAAAQPEKPEPETEEPASVEAELVRRIDATERKVVALTDAVSRLIEHLERRHWTASPAERRSEVRLPGVDAAVYVDRQRYRVIDWSKSGFCIQVGESELLGRRRFPFRFTLELLDETIEFQGFATPTRREGTRLAARFVHLDPAVEAKLAAVVRRLSGGRV